MRLRGKLQRLISPFNSGTCLPIVIAVGARPNQTLLPALQGKVSEVYTVGDCVEPRRAYQAIHDGSRVAREI